MNRKCMEMDVAMLSAAALRYTLGIAGIFFVLIEFTVKLPFRSWLIIAITSGFYWFWNPGMLKMYRYLYGFKIRDGKFVGMDELGRECKDEDWQPRA